MLPAPQVSIFSYADPDGRTVQGIRLLRPLRVLLDIDRDPDAPLYIVITIPEGFVSDGASVPRLFWRLLSPPIDPTTITPSIVHDWLYLHGASLGITRAEADAWYARALSRNGYPLWKCALTYTGVRLGGASHWSQT